MTTRGAAGEASPLRVPRRGRMATSGERHAEVITLASGIALRDGRLLMVASRYPNHPQPLWNLPGGRQLPGELLCETVVREFLEETGLRVDPGEIAYVSESYAEETHFLSVTFRVIVRQTQDEGQADRGPSTEALRACVQGDRRRDDHVAEVAWVLLSEVAERVAVAVVREPLIAYLEKSLPQRYAGFHDAGVTIEWPPDSR